MTNLESLTLDERRLTAQIKWEEELNTIRCENTKLGNRQAFNLRPPKMITFSHEIYN